MKEADARKTAQKRTNKEIVERVMAFYHSISEHLIG